MKKLIVAVLMLSGITCFARNINISKVPEPVKYTFYKNFPEVKEAKWEMEHGKYEANFEKDGQNQSALFDENGKWLETETHLDPRLLPAKVVMYVKNNYDGHKIKEAAKLTMPNGETMYEAEVKCMDLMFDANGKFIKAICNKD